MPHKMGPEEFEAYRRLKMHGSDEHRKAPYHNRADAKAAARRLSRKDARMNAYPCDYCDFFHVGHSQPASKSYAEWAPIDHSADSDEELLTYVQVGEDSDDELFTALDEEDAAG